MVGMAIGAGDVDRARRIAWTGAGLAAFALGAVGLLVAAAPDLWAGLFSGQPGVLDAARSYLRWAGGGFAFFGVGLALYFSAQGAGRVLGPVLAGTLRLLLVAAGGWWLWATAAGLWTLFALVGLAMLAYGAATALSVLWLPWSAPRALPVPAE
jgi:Na+-driven multidrug efflux pump